MLPRQPDRIDPLARGHELQDAVLYETLVVLAQGAVYQFRDGFKLLLILFAPAEIAGHGNAAAARREGEAVGRREPLVARLDHDLPDAAERNVPALPAEQSPALPVKRPLPDVEMEGRELVHEPHRDPRH